MHVSSPNPKSNYELSTTFFLEDEEFFEAINSFISLSNNLHLGSLIACLQGPHKLIGAPYNIISLVKVINPFQIISSLITDKYSVDFGSMVTAIT
jgi:hypothetical protein